ncbi:hypothetical protein KKI90_20570 [Xenorhabdus bovienii]|uniref:hypothetical protein n=1 Tax=Xenorhabdus bovienii TaxID=40576 RepID=UPI00237CF339|nr:hypothetical protein [Xenorhabdus bovienii]MDE1488823.1 hypothetical protein [Xenorhabdus bovienii]MDE9479663.1 hypothetical protein [Xenorhabdus bovienii]MDE9532514.1 hypothetical protein [Xenorhabdus bovienii]
MRNSPIPLFKHELGQKVWVAISGETGHIKARAEYTHGINHYLIHYQAADGRAVDAWFEEGELSLTGNRYINMEYPPT